MRSVLVTGSSSGIGRALARRFAREGWRVFATMRRPESGEELRRDAAAQGWTLTTPALDVTSDASVAAAVDEAHAAAGGALDVVVNNAGYYLWGAVEETTPEELAAQLDTNLLGVLRVTRAVLPPMRARRTGTIVNMSSVSGRVVLPAVGPYHASKWALEALSESLRYELIPFGVNVVLIEPGPYDTGLHANEKRAAASEWPDSPYAAQAAAYKRQLAALRRAELDGLCDVVLRAATARRPKLRWPVGPTSFSGTVGRHLAPDWLYELVMRVVFRLRRPK